LSVLICGSIAYDNIMVFQGRFKEHILPDQIHILNVSFLVPELRREFGGCAGNVAYNLRRLGGEPRIMATVGSDFAPYRAWLTRQGGNLDHVLEVPELLTAQA
jgi:adenosine kinase